MHRFRHVLIGTLVIYGTAHAADFVPPATWTGTTAGATDGNPHTDGTAARWRLDQVWPADPTEGGNYVPLTWNGTDWNAKENSFGGQPGASVAAGVVTLSVRGPWQGAEAPRTAALAFIAPTAGVYQVSGVIDVSRWSGDQAISVHLYRRDPVKKSVRPVQEVPVEVKAGNPLAAKATLAAGEELLLIAEIGAFHTAGGIAIRELKISEP